MDVSNKLDASAAADQNISFVYADNSKPEEIERKPSKDGDESVGSHDEKHRKKRKKVSWQLFIFMLSLMLFDSVFFVLFSGQEKK